MKSLKFLPLIVICLFSSSCKKDKTPTNTPGSYVLGPKTVIIDNTTSLVLESVDSVKVVFDGNTTQLESLTVGSIIVSEITTNAPYGFLRKITNIQKVGTVYTFTTVEVPLEEAFEELHIDYTKTFTTSDTTHRTNGANFTLDFPDMILYDGDGNNSTVLDQIKLSENVVLTPAFHIVIDIGLFRMNYFKVEGSFETVLDQSVNAGGNVGTISKKIKIYEQPMTPIPLLGGILVVVPNLSLNTGADASINVSISASQNINSNVSAYLEYKNSTWSKDYTQTLQSTTNFSGLNGNATAKVFLQPAIDFKLYNSDELRGSITAEAYLKASGTLLPAPDCELRAGVGAGADANFLGIAHISYPDIFDYSKVLFTCSANNPTVTDIDGNIYHTIKIGTQTWMVENLKVSRYRNGDPIPYITSPSIWAALETADAWCYYNNDSTNNSLYGKLYNWNVVNDSRKVAPVGWHVPSDAEWTILTDYLGGAAIAGGKMKSTNNWNSPNTGATNSSAFSGLPGGERNFTGAFADQGSYGYWWSTTPAVGPPGYYFRRLAYNSNSTFSYYPPAVYGLSVRCIKD